MPITVHFNEENEDWLSEKETKKDKKKPVKPEGKSKKAPKKTKTAAENLFLAHRVAQRHEQELADRFAKATRSLLPEYTEALKALEAGDPAPITDFGKKLHAIVLPTGKPADWFWALGTTKRNALKNLVRGVERFEMDKSLLTKSDIYRSIVIGGVKEWAKLIRTLELAVVSGDSEKEFSHGPFTVVPMDGVSKAKMAEALEALDQAVAKVKPHFPEVLYGKVFFSNHLKKGVAAMYIYTEDKLYVNVLAKKRFSDMYTILHELGHRYDFQLLDKDLKREFWALSTRKEFERATYDEKLREQMGEEALAFVKARKAGSPLPKMSPQLEMWLRWAVLTPDPKTLTTNFISGFISGKDFQEGIKGKKDQSFMTTNLLHGPLSVTPYGATKPMENFAESFAHYVLGMDQPQELASIIERAKK